MTARVLAGLAAGLLTTGCVVTSLRPLHTAENTVFDARLVGDWVDPNETGTVWRFQEEGDGYAVTAEADGETTARYEARLVRLGRSRFLEMRPVESDLFEIPAHFIGRCEIEGETLTVEPLDPAAVRHLDAEGKIDVEFEALPGDRGLLVLSATPRLEAFVLTCDRAGAFGEAIRYLRAGGTAGRGRSYASCARP